MTESNVVAAVAPSVPARGRVSLVEKMASRFHVEPAKLLDTLKATAFRQREGTVVTNEQMMALLVVADQYDLNPFTKEIFAFEDKGGIVPIVSVDGWIRIINQHPQLDGIEFRWAEEFVTLQGGKPCPAWCEVVLRRKDRQEPIIVREYLDEVYVPPRQGRSKFKQGETYEVSGPWQTHTKRMLRHKTLIQGSRVAFGFAGIYDEDEANRILEASRGADGAYEVKGSEVMPASAPRDATEKMAAMRDRLAGRVAPAEDAPAEPTALEVDPDSGEILSGAPGPLAAAADPFQGLEDFDEKGR